jgi:uncharacterized protein YoxC
LSGVETVTAHVTPRRASLASTRSSAQGEPHVSFLDKAKDIAEDVKDKAEDIVDKVEDKLPEGVKEKLDDVKEKVGDLAAKIGDKLPGGLGDKIEGAIPGDSDGDGK